MQKLSGASLKDICGLEIRYFQLSTFCRESFQKFFSPFGDYFLSRIHKELISSSVATHEPSLASKLAHK